MTERVKPCHRETECGHRFLYFHLRPWSHTCSCVALHTCCCLRLFSSPPRTAPRTSRVALERRGRLERHRTPPMLSFWDHSWCVKSVLAVPRLAELQQTTLRWSDPMNCLATHLLRYLVRLSMSTHLAVRCALPVLSQH